MLEDALRKETQGGFPHGDDAFDAVVGLFGMLQVCLGQREPGEPRGSRKCHLLQVMWRGPWKHPALKARITFALAAVRSIFWVGGTWIMEILGKTPLVRRIVRQEESAQPTIHS